MKKHSNSSQITNEQNRFWRNYGYHRGEVTLRSLPEIFAIESTNFCNLKCIMCPRGEPDVMRRPLGNMSNCLFKKILADACFFSEPCWFHWFGEPLLNPNLFDQITLAKPKVPNLGISTNATLLDAKNSERILDSELDTILIALDGASKEVYERVRKGSFTFETVYANVERFLKMRQNRKRNKLRVILSIIRMSDTVEELDTFREKWTQYGADEIRIKRFVNWGGQDEDLTQMAVPEDLISLRSPRKHACKSLWTNLVITWDGKVVPCCFDYNALQVMGDLNCSTLAEIWNDTPYRKMRRAELDGVNNCALCANCSQAPGHQRDPNWGADGLQEVA